MNTTLLQSRRIPAVIIPAIFRTFASVMSMKREYNGMERPEFTPDSISVLKADEVFVFGSNLEGMHGGGAAYYAFCHFGAVTATISRA